MAIPLAAARLLLYHVTRQWQNADLPARGLLANKAKYLATQVGLQTTPAAMQAVGGHSALKDLPVERDYRDLRTCTLMPPTVDRMLETVGKIGLCVDASMLSFGDEPPASSANDSCPWLGPHHSTVLDVQRHGPAGIGLAGGLPEGDNLGMELLPGHLQ
ncbi:hypothetical protein NKDENANG_01318 [Candidatus Entotheonellaceae bacterium PAL068K]